MSEEERRIIGMLGSMQVSRPVQVCDPLVDRLRCSKWFDMLEALKNSGKTSRKLKTRARKGIPESIRGIAWPILAGADAVVP